MMAVGMFWLRHRDLGAPGWYDIEIRFSNGGGGAGSITGIGFAVDPDGPGGQDWMAASNDISDVTSSVTVPAKLPGDYQSR